MLKEDQLNLAAEAIQTVLGFVKSKTIIEHKIEVGDKTLLQIITAACIITIDTGIKPTGKSPELYNIKEPSAWTKASKGLILPYTDDVTEKVKQASSKLSEIDLETFNDNINALSFTPVAALKNENDEYPVYAVLDAPKSIRWVYRDGRAERTRNTSDFFGYFAKISSDTVNFFNVIDKFNEFVDGVSVCKLGIYTSFKFVSKKLGMTVSMVTGKQTEEEEILIDNKTFKLKTDYTFERKDNMNVNINELPKLDSLNTLKGDKEIKQETAIPEPINKPVNKPSVPTAEVVDTPPFKEEPQDESTNQEEGGGEVTFDSVIDDVLGLLDTLKENKKAELDNLKELTANVKWLRKRHKNDIKEANSVTKQNEELIQAKAALKKIQNLINL